ncbi:hypothetical protein J6590_068161 [Homalodisca vitripennis]|nr:hypothetical protein J6590_068161 [Homalodisca vitripennis]
MPRYDVSASADELDYDELLWKLNLRTPTGTRSKALIFPPSVSSSHAADGAMWLQCQGIDGSAGCFHLKSFNTQALRGFQCSRAPPNRHLVIVVTHGPRSSCIT